MRPVFSCAILFFALGCGARTGLIVPPEEFDATLDAADARDAADVRDAIDAFDAPEVSVLDQCNGDGVAAVASGEALPKDLAVMGSYVYWITDESKALVGKVKKTGKGGGPLITLADPEIDPEVIAVDGSRVYWFAGESRNKVHFEPLDGGAIVELPTVLHPSVPPTLLAVDATWVYFNDVGILAIGKTGGSQRPIDGAAVFELVADASGAYFSGHTSDTESPYAIRSYVPATSRVTVLDHPPYVSKNRYTLATDASFVYFADAAGIARLPKTGGKARPVMTTPKAVTALAVNEKNLYWMDGGFDGTLARIFVAPKTGGPTRTIADSVRGVSRIVLDERCIYWLDGIDSFDARVMSAPN